MSEIILCSDGSRNSLEYSSTTLVLYKANTSITVNTSFFLQCMHISEYVLCGTLSD